MAGLSVFQCYLNRDLSTLALPRGAPAAANCPTGFETVTEEPEQQQVDEVFWGPTSLEKENNISSKHVLHSSLFKCVLIC